MLSLVFRIRVAVPIDWLGDVAVRIERTGAVACSFRHGVDGDHGCVADADMLRSSLIAVLVPEMNMFIETALDLLCSARRNRWYSDST